jgi:hypothetical protein
VRRQARVLVGIAGALLLSAAVSPADAADAPTEKTKPASQRQVGADYAGDLTYGCTLKRRGDDVKVQCDQEQTTSLLFDFTVPKAALDFRVRSVVTTVESGEQSQITTGGVRLSPTTFQASFNTYGAGKYVVRSMRISYKVASAYDDRPCVTNGEWALVDPDRGGNADRIGQVTDIFDTRGQRTQLITDSRDGTQYQVRHYPRCGAGKKREVVFVRYEVGGPWQTDWLDDYLQVPQG